MSFAWMARPSTKVSCTCTNTGTSTFAMQAVEERAVSQRRLQLPVFPETPWREEAGEGPGKLVRGRRWKPSRRLQLSLRVRCLHRILMPPDNCFLSASPPCLSLSLISCCHSASVSLRFPFASAFLFDSQHLASSTLVKGNLPGFQGRRNNVSRLRVGGDLPENVVSNSSHRSFSSDFTSILKPALILTVCEMFIQSQSQSVVCRQCH